MPPFEPQEKQNVEANEAVIEIDSDTPPHSQNQTDTNTANQSDIVLLYCMREGCDKPPVDDPRWDKEYCSSDCVIAHCKSIFENWVQSNKKTEKMEVDNDSEVEIIEIN